jgi:hypothetical protein
MEKFEETYTTRQTIWDIRAKFADNQKNFYNSVFREMDAA